MASIEKVLTWIHKAQYSCFGTPISFNVETSKGNLCDKVIRVEINIPYRTFNYLITSDMTPNDIGQCWGKIKDQVDQLLDVMVGHRVNKHGKIKQ